VGEAHIMKIFLMMILKFQNIFLQNIDDIKVLESEYLIQDDIEISEHLFQDFNDSKISENNCFIEKNIITSENDDKFIVFDDSEEKISTESRPMI
jgi:hypothetical protein